jgi:hypothetical protein
MIGILIAHERGANNLGAKSEKLVEILWSFVLIFPVQ